MEQTRSGYVCIIGRPNVGKSTLMNQIIGQKIAITSNKPQTTRNKIQTVYTDETTQMIFMDTPGMHKAKNKLGEFMVNSARGSLKEADVALWLVEPSDYIGAMEKDIIELLKTVRIPVILVINKVDTVKKDDLFGIIDLYSKQMDFDEVVPLSALNGNNVDTLIACIRKYLPYGPFYYDEETVTDQPEKQIVAEIIREKALRCLSDEIPHGIAVGVESMKFSKNSVNIEATVYCERDSHKGIIIGKGGQMLKKIGTLSRGDIEKMLEKKVNLNLWVKVKKDWRDSDFMLKNFGYKMDDSE